MPEAATSARIRFGQAAIGVGAIGLWEWGARAGLLDRFFFSRPLDVAARLRQWIADGSIWPHLGTTLLEAFLAFSIGVVLGVVFGFLLARTPAAALLLEPYIRMFNALPRVVLAPIFLLWFGLGVWSKVMLGVTVVFFIVFFNTFRGVRDADAVILNNARMLGASEGQLIRHVLVPSALTWIFSSLHISIGFAMISVVVGEYLGSSKGVGYVISQAEGVFDTTGVFAGMAVLAAVVLVVGAGVERLERWLLRWKPDAAARAEERNA
jgi:NitT/TauT family transport system permease protein